MPNTNTKPQWMMHGITAEPVEEYLYSLLPARDEVLAKMENEASKRDIPIVGPVVGRVLHQLALTHNAKAVFEHGDVTYTDSDRKNADEARGYFEQAGLANRITIKIGDALELLSEQKQAFDIIFCDVDKEDYPRALRLAIPRLRKGGLLVADNVLWSGKVAQKKAPDASTKAIQEFNRLLYSSPDLFTTILPIRDGVAVATKL